MDTRDLMPLFEFLGIDPVELNDDGDRIWPRGRGKAGYGQLHRRGRGMVYVHREVWTFLHGPVPSGHHVDHVWKAGCRSRACFEPDHLEAVSPKENARRTRFSHKGMPLGCGHPSAAFNRKKDGACKLCHSKRERERTNPQREEYNARFAERTKTILALRGSGVSRPEVARQVGCSVETVRRTELGLLKRTR